MGVTAQQFRMAVGMFAGGRSPAPPWARKGQHSSGWKKILVMILYLFLILHVILCSIREPQGVVNRILLQSVSGCGVSDGYCGDIVMVMRILLIMAGDVELNPGPIDSEELTRGLATLITEAPVGVKPVLSVWAPDKVDMASEWNSKDFTVPVLKEAMAWLHNSTPEEVGKQLKRKLDLVTALPVAIERLLPDICGGCQTSYSVKRVDKPTLQCAGCHQGIHEECLHELLGEGLSTLSTIHGSLTWMCQTCTPSYRMMTVMAPGGTQKPVSRRQGGRQGQTIPTAAPSAPATPIPPVPAVHVEDIVDRLAAMTVSPGEKENTDVWHVAMT